MTEQTDNASNRAVAGESIAESEAVGINATVQATFIEDDHASTDPLAAVVLESSAQAPASPVAVVTETVAQAPAISDTAPVASVSAPATAAAAALKPWHMTAVIVLLIAILAMSIAGLVVQVVGSASRVNITSGQAPLRMSDQDVPSTYPGNRSEAR